MRKTVLAAIALLAASVAHADDGDFNLFISPSGQPFVAPKTEPYPIVAWFNETDANHDGRIDLAEFRADAERFFTVLDRNKDGVLDSLEIAIYEHYYVPEILNPRSSDAGGLLMRVNLQYGGGGMGGGGRGGMGQIDPGGGSSDDSTPRQRLNTDQGAVHFSLFSAPEPVLSADRNLDGFVTLKEFQAQADRHFAVLDVQKRGFFTLDDLPQTPAERESKAKRGSGRVH
jgi:hypothetical protein